MNMKILMEGVNIVVSILKLVVQLEKDSRKGK